MSREPDFPNLLRILRREATQKPALFELFMNWPVYRLFSGRSAGSEDPLEILKWQVEAYAAGGYDYVGYHACSMQFPTGKRHQGDTISLNEGACITDWESFRSYPWPDPDQFDYSRFDRIAPYLPKGMKLMAFGPNGVLENVIGLVGYDRLCYLLYEDPDLAQAVFDAVGSRMVRYYENAVSFPTVGMLMSNDDWGFNTPNLSFPFHDAPIPVPWHKKIVEVAHNAGMPALLHSCGNLEAVMEDVIEDMGYDGKHSYEDNILPVEEAYRRWGDRIAILGGVDLDFLVRQPVESIRTRCENLLDMTREKGGYLLGSGNSIPEYVPMDHYLAMVDLVRNG